MDKPKGFIIIEIYEGMMLSNRGDTSKLNAAELGMMNIEMDKIKHRIVTQLDKIPPLLKTGG